MNKLIKRLTGTVAVVAALTAVTFATSAAAQLTKITLTVDENGNGTIVGFLGPQPLPSGLMADPGPGGLASVLTYDLLNPPGLVAGDVLLQDGVNGPILDVIRFNPGEVGPGGGVGSLLFYSDNIDGFDSLGDTPGPPGALYPNFIVILEVGTEANNGAVYTPLSGQPGFVAGASLPVEYTFISDGFGPPSVPEPATWALMLVGVGAVGFAARRGRKTAAVLASA